MATLYILPVIILWVQDHPTYKLWGLLNRDFGISMALNLLAWNTWLFARTGFRYPADSTGLVRIRCSPPMACVQRLRVLSEVSWQEKTK